MTGRIRERQDLEASLSSKRGPLPAPILDYYEQVCERDGGIDRTREYFRLFCLPGCAHGGGTGRATTGSTNNAGIRKQLTDWREKGIAPDKIVSNWRSGGIALPVAPYPGLYVKDADGSWRVRDVKRGVARIDASARKTDGFPKTPKQKNKENIK